jgi:hypothetical protein
MTRANSSSKRRSAMKSAPRAKAVKKTTKLTAAPSTNVRRLVKNSRSSTSANVSQQVNGSAKSPASTDPVFHLFPDLPTEIRLKIWKLVVPKAAVVQQAKGLGYKPLYTIMLPRPTPVVLHVCHESRNEFLYRDDESANSGKNHPLYRQAFPSTNGLMVHFSFEVDTLYMAYPHKSVFNQINYGNWPPMYVFKTRLDLAEKDVVRELRFLAIHMNQLQQVDRVFLKSLARFEKLEELIFLREEFTTILGVTNIAAQDRIIDRIDTAKKNGLVKEELVLKFRDLDVFQRDPRA